MKDLGLKTNPLAERCASPDACVKWYKKMTGKRDQLGYEIDGCVFKVNSLEDHETLGNRASNPRWAIAWKFEPRRESTTIRDIEVSVGRTGALTPVAVLEPVHIGGVEVTHVTLHNQDEVERLDVATGDTVIVERAGDVIPHVVKVTKKKSKKRKTYHLPSKCPVCGGEVSRPEGEAETYCTNPSCPARIKQSIQHFGSKKALDIDGLGEKLVSQLVDQELVQELDDLFCLKRSDLEKLERMGRKSAENLVKSIGNAKEKATLPGLIYGLGIPHVGRAVSSDLATEFGSLEALASADKQRLKQMDGIGETMASAIVDWFDNPKNKKLLKKLKRQEIDPKLKDTSGFFSGKTVVFTGTLNSMTRDEASDAVERAGGKVTGSVSGNTDFLVVGKNPGSTKTSDAEEHDVKVVDESYFLEKI
jgi:DNA ligase (NAD+)